MASANMEGASVSVLLNRGDGRFQAKRDYATGSSPSSIAIGDLNGDRKQDIVTANGEGGANRVSVLLNKGGGSFRAKADYSAGATPVEVAIGDLNGDGKPDLAAANLGANTASVLLNRGDGTFRAKRDYGTGRRPTSVAIGDLNGDGRPDLAIANASAAAVSVFTNEGRFEAKVDFPIHHEPSAVAIGDLNGDDRLDVATANGDAMSVSTLINTPGLCTVQRVTGIVLPAAKRTLARANCRVGRVRRAYSRAKRGRVILQKPYFGAVLPGGSKVDLVVSRGRRRS
jgi:hypothetical protein